MRKKDVWFSIYQFILDWWTFSLDDFSLKIPDLFEKEEIWWDIVSVRKIIKDKSDDNRFIEFYFEGWDRFPYSEKVIDVEEDKEVNNPRNSSLVELDEQLFVLFDINTQRIYISDQRQKSFLLEWFKSWFWKKVSIKALIDKWDFLKKIGEIWEISFSAEPTLFLEMNTLWEYLSKDIFGYGATDIRINLSYKNWKNLWDDLKSKIINLINNRDVLKNLTIIWKTDDKLESILNMNEVINKISFKIEPNEKTKKLDYITIFNYLTYNIKLNEN